jgi:PKD repeat protein
MEPNYKFSKRPAYLHAAFLTLLTFCTALLSVAHTDKANACTADAKFMYTLTDQTVSFINLSTGANKYVWYFGDGETSTDFEPVHLYSSPNRYSVTLWAYDSTISGCNDSAQNYSILIPGCMISANFQFKVEDSTVTFVNQSYNFLGTSNAYEWHFGDGSSDYGSDPVHKYAGTGPYDIMYVFSDTGFYGCSDTVRRTFSLDDCDVVADFTYTVIGTHKVKITNTSVNANDYSLPFDSNGEYIIDFGRPGTFRVTLYARNSWCVTKDSAIKEVDIFFPGCYANARFSFGTDSNSTFAGILYDYSVHRPGASYMWFFGDGDSSSSETPTHVYPGPGSYSLCLRITDSTCISMFCDTITYDSSGNMMATVPFSLEVIDAVLSVKEVQSAAQKISVFPNPGNGLLTVTNTNYAIREIQVYDLQGKLMLTESFNDLKVALDISKYTNGVYMLIIHDEAGKTQVVRVIKS